MTTRSAREPDAPVTSVEPRSILLLIAGDVADTLRVTPYLKALRRRYPSARLAALVSERGVAVLRGCPHLDEVIVRRVSRHDEPPLRSTSFKLSHLLDNWRQIRGRFDLVISFLDPHSGGGPLWGLLAYLSGAPRRVGYDLRGTGRLFTDNLGTADPGESDAERMWRLLATVDVTEPAEDPFVEVWTADEDDAAAEALLSEHGVRPGDPVFAICPGSDWSCQQWSPERWAAVGDSLADRWSARIAILGVSDEQWIASSITTSMRHRPIDLTGRTSLAQLGAVLKRCRLALTLESAPAAIALAVGTPTVALFGSIPVWIDGQHRAPAVGIRKCEGLVPTQYTLCKLAKMRRAVHRCDSPECIGGDGLWPIGPEDVIRAACAVMSRSPADATCLGVSPGQTSTTGEV